MMPRQPHLTLAGLLVFCVWVIALVDGLLVAAALLHYLDWAF